jgi:hypothetical protein
MLEQHPQLRDEGRIVSGYNPSLIDQGEWISKGSYGLDQGLVAMMIENHRTGLIWSLMRSSPYIRQGLARAGFSGGWL